MNNREKLKELQDNNISVIETTGKELLDNIQGIKNEIAYTYEEDEFYVFDGEKWILYSEIPKPNFTMTQYELNKMLISPLEQLTIEEIVEKCKVINQWQIDNKNNYYMMLGKEIGYYTVFKVDIVYELTNLGTGVLDCLSNVGDIYSIEINDDNAIEIWVKPFDQEEVTVLYLFPYDQGVVTIGE